MKKINVLSLFDGMSCGQIALQRAGFNVGNYFASEIDKPAITVAKSNFPKTQHLGDVTNWKEWQIEWGSIDLVIAGSPCQGFSFAGKQLAFDDPRSKLFFVFVDILNHIKKQNPNLKFLLENVKMKPDDRHIITTTLGIEPLLINSNLVSAQNRQRWYWANWNFSAPKDKNIFLESILEKSHPFEIRKKSKCVRVGGRQSYDRHEWDSASNCHSHKFTPIECERLQTVPDGYTSTASNAQRYRMLGNGWTVDLITHIFSSIFESEETLGEMF